MSHEGSLTESRTADDHYVIVTYWRSFEEHERSHADEVFNSKFAALATMCSDTKNWGTTCSGKARQGTDNEGGHHSADYLIGSWKGAPAARARRLEM